MLSFKAKSATSVGPGDKNMFIVYVIEKISEFNSQAMETAQMPHN
jgi:hypothetical protein